MRLSIIIPVYNNWNFTKSCLKDLSKLPNDHEIIVIDNGSSDLTQTEIKNYNVIYKRNEHNKGFAKSSNQGFEFANGEFVLFLNNDIRVIKDFDTWTNNLILAAGNGFSGPTGGMLDDKLNFVRETNQLIGDNHYLSGWCLCGTQDNFKKMILPGNEYQGPFTEEFVTYFEDTDLSFRARDLGLSLTIVDVPVVHFGKTTSRKLNLSKLYFDAKLKFINKWASRIK